MSEGVRGEGVLMRAFLIAILLFVSCFLFSAGCSEVLDEREERQRHHEERLEIIDRNQHIISLFTQGYYPFSHDDFMNMNPQEWQAYCMGVRGLPHIAVYIGFKAASYSTHLPAMVACLLAEPEE